MQGIGDIFNVLFMFLPWWALAIIAVVIGALALPGWLKNTRLKPISSRVREMAMADTAAERDVLKDQVLQTADDDGDLLAWVVMQAEKRKQRPLWEEALTRLRALPKFRDEARRLEKRWNKDIPPARHPIEEAAAIEGFIEDGLLVKARDRLDLALVRFPDDPDLQAAFEHWVEANAEAHEET
jgi:hypothetical protein